MERMLLIVDPQVDFIDGALPIPGAGQAMERLADYVLLSDGRYSVKIVTADRHPYNHCSFRECGGEWPRHCVHDTEGAAIWPSLFEAVYSTSGNSLVLHKGESKDTDQYSIFQNQVSADLILSIVRQQGIGSIDICGLAGDICLLNTLRDAMTLMPDISFRVLSRFSPSIDDGKALEKFLVDNHLQNY